MDNLCHRLFCAGIIIMVVTSLSACTPGIQSADSFPYNTPYDPASTEPGNTINVNSGSPAIGLED